MSRRKQSNPKPLKREDDDWVSDADAERTSMPDDGDATVAAATPASKSSTSSSPPPPAASVSPASQEETAATAPTPTPTPEEHIPRLRLKVGLATDPALRQPSDITAEFLAALPTALASSPYFCLPPPTASKPEAPTVQVPVYMCTPCCIRFSSLSTLEAHQTYYCSHRVKPAKGRGDSDSEEGKSMCSDMAEATSNDAENSAKALRTGKQYACPHCSYSADKKVSLNRHMRMHATSPGSGSEPVPPSSPHLIDRYCQDCDIRFSSAKTLRAHKQHYCGTRHNLQKAAAPNQPASPESGDGQPYLALPTSPVVLVPLAMLRGASLLPAPAALAHNTACILLPDGSTQPTSGKLKRKSPPPAMRCSDASLPLDLSMRRTPDSGSPEPGDLVVDLDSEEDEKENRRHIVSEEIICAPSLPMSSSSSTASPISPALSSSSLSNAKRPRLDETSRGRTGSCSPKSLPSPRNGIVHNGVKHHTDRRYSMSDSRGDASSPEDLVKSQTSAKILHPGGAMNLDLLPPQVLVKQGVSKCQECNIVFCRHDNYVAHKKHYCSARAEASVGGEPEGKGPSPVSPAVSPAMSAGKEARPASPASVAAPAKPVTLYQFICAACGIKFTSLDNLTAHQAYYCPKRADKDDGKPAGAVTNSRRCVKCKAVNVSGETHVCGGGWKCLCCDVVSMTASAAQRHMDSHAGVKAFRCTICRYKGNTLRGMRTHIRMHFEKRTADLQEVNFISCVIGDTEPTSPVAVAPAPAPPCVSPEPDVGRQERLHFCELCNYSSTYKGNVVRHHKLVHNLTTRDDEAADDPPPAHEIKRENEDEEVRSPDVENRVAIKKEPLDGSDSELENNSNHALENNKLLNNDSAVKKTGPKYCKSCDISFTYLSTFIAHKKFYCLSHSKEQRPGTAETSVS